MIRQFAMCLETSFTLKTRSWKRAGGDTMARVVRIIHNNARQRDCRAVSFKLNWLSYLVLTNEGLSCLDNVLTLNTSLHTVMAQYSSL